MPRNRVLSFMSQWGGGLPRSSAPGESPSNTPSPTRAAFPNRDITPVSAAHIDATNRGSPTTAQRARSDSRPSSRPVSMIQTYQPPVMEVSQDTLPELQPIFAFLNSHSNKLYQEGYFLKLHDLDARGRPSPDRHWQECFAQLVGTVLSMWDAAQLDQAGDEGEVLPSFINLADASIKMIPSLPMNGSKSQTLQNVLSISTAANNRYLFHFNSLNSLTQWTAGIRLAMYEHTTLQEAYTGSLIAGKGKTLNNIRMIMERTRVKQEDWARVRFGAGTPWRRCWCVITPPDEKEYQKFQKQLKKKTIYDRSTPALKGDVKFYESRKVTKKSIPIATIKDAYAAYAIYPQSKPLIDQSTLVKIEGTIAVHSNPETTTEGFVFVMPEVHPAVSGFEHMLRFLFPVFDVFNLYGRPERLIPDPLDPRGLMFAMPTNRRYGYLDILDVAALIHTEGSANWTERQWRKELKNLTLKRMTSPVHRGSRRSRISRTSLPPSRSGTIRFDDGASQSQPGSRRPSPSRGNESAAPRRIDSAPPGAQPFETPRHQRSISEATGYNPSRLAYGMTADYKSPTPPSAHGMNNQVNDDYSRSSPVPEQDVIPELRNAAQPPPPAPVAAPPAFTHAPSQRPPTQPKQVPEIRQANSQVDAATLHQMAEATSAQMGAAATWNRSQDSLGNRRSGDYNRRSEDYDRRYADATNRSYDGYSSGERLPTIPASPYAQVERPQLHTEGEVTGPPVPEHGVPAQQQSYFAQSPPLPQTPDRAEFSLPQSPPSGGRILRKPVPGRSSISSRTSKEAPSSPTSSSLSSLRSNVIDPDALDAFLGLHEAPSEASSDYNDALSTNTPDYASVKSESPKRPERRTDRPRAGVLRTVGTGEPPKLEVAVGDVVYGAQETKQEDNTLIPIDFGPTYALTPGAPRPGTSGTLTPSGHDRDRSKSRESLSFPLSGFGATPSPSDVRRESYFAGRASPGYLSHQRTHSKSPGADKTFRSGSPGVRPSPSPENRHSVAWQPGTAIGGSHARRSSLDPEEWVQQRAAMAAQPRPSPQLRASPLHNQSRTPSGDWSNVPRPSTREGMPSRPHSRGPSVMLNSSMLTDKEPSLSAREREYVARVTGTPLVELANAGSTRDGKASQHDTSAGLVGAIQARENEKKHMRSGSSGYLVQQAILSKQQHANAQAAQLAAQQQQQQQMMMLQQMQAQQTQAQQMQMLQQQQQQQAAMAQGGGNSPYMMMQMPVFPGQPQPGGYMAQPPPSQQPYGYGGPGYAQSSGFPTPPLPPQQLQQQQQQRQPSPATTPQPAPSTIWEQSTPQNRYAQQQGRGGMSSWR